MVIDFFYLLFFFLLGFAVLHWFHPTKINYITHYKKVSLGLGISGLFVFLLYFHFVRSFIYSISYPSILFLICFYILALFLYSYLGKKISHTKVKKLEKEHIYFASFDLRFILPWSFNIIGQQLGIAVIVGILLNMNLSKIDIILLFTVISFAAHFYYFLRHHKPIFTIAATIGAPIFVFMLLYVPSGVVYNYIIHWSFYILAGVYLGTRKS